MKIVIAGASGFIGSLVTQRLWEQSHALRLLSRRPISGGKKTDQEWILWNPDSGGAWQGSVDDVDGIINLTGESIAEKRWTSGQKRKIISSRLDTTRALVDAIAAANRKPKFLINASAVGYYGPHGDEILTEKSPAGKDFLGRLCVDWENEASRAQEFGVRVVLLRTGIVLGKGKGALAKMVLPFRLFVGGPLGSGAQWFPWIHVDDEVGLINFLIEKEDAAGPVNATAPNPVRMEEFSKALGEVLNRPSWAQVPASALALLLGEMADMLLTGQRAMPETALKMGYNFKYTDVTQALRSLGL